MKRILGIDPGLNTTGYGIIDVSSGRIRLCEAGVIRSRMKASLAEKVKEIHDGVCEVIDDHRPDVVVMEELYSHYDHPMAAIQMGHARGCICLAAAQANIAVTSYSATKIKKSLTGNGHASKEQIQRAIQLLLGLEKPPEPPDVADALAVALCQGEYGRCTANK